MKAVYEMPRVNFEAFAANNAISSCTQANKNVEFDCIMGGHSDNTHVLSSAIGVEGCKLNASFADYKNQTESTSDDITDTTVNGWGNGHSNYNDYIEFSRNPKTVDVKEAYQSSFIGWLYVSSSSGFTGSSITGWSISNGNLNFDSSNVNRRWHALLAPVFGVLSAVATSA